MKVVRSIIWASWRSLGWCLALVLLLGTSQPGHAGQYYKCTDSEGKIYITNSQCPGEVKEQRSYNLNERSEAVYRAYREYEETGRQIEARKRELEKDKKDIKREREIKWIEAKNAMERGKCIFPEDTYEGRMANINCRSYVKKKYWDGVKNNLEAAGQLETIEQVERFYDYKGEVEFSQEMKQLSNDALKK